MKILVFGDICLYNLNSKSYKIDPKLIKELESADLVIGNLENVITDSTIKKPLQAFNLKSTPDSVNLLKELHLDAVSLANNHIQDYLQIGIEDTLSSLTNNGIAYFGIGATTKDALKPFTFEKDNLKVAIWGGSRYANIGDRTLGTASDSCPEIFNQVKEYKVKGYFVVVYNHWGYEYVRYPSPRDRKLAHKLICCGADVVIGSHPHIYQGIEEYKGKSIIYSLGNFIFHSSVYNVMNSKKNDERMNNSYFLSVDLDDSHINVNIVGFETTDDYIRLYSQQENSCLEDDIVSISSVFSNKIKYLKAYYSNAHSISAQNKRVRSEFQQASKLSLSDRFNLYRNANIQDLKNRTVGLLIGLLK